jgi:regulator of sirC expression with transglutaminase-like and TPR domain
MIAIMKRWLFLLLLPLLLHAEDLFLKSRLSSLDPLSVSEHLAFYELYPQTNEGQKALSQAWHLLSGGKLRKTGIQVTLPTVDIQAIISLVTRQNFEKPVKLSLEQLNAIEDLGGRLDNRFLKGHEIWTREQLLSLQPHEIDLSRGLLIEQFNENIDEIRQYEAGLDLIALQILARLPQNASPEDYIREINRFVFQEMKFRFPPHSLYAKDIDLYTFLPSVMDSREGVCLGVSILYLCLAQRMGLPLEIITPPGHIYVRYRKGVKVVNIETTARGIDLPSETYLGIDTRRLEQRNMKEVIGMAYFNQASVAWGQKDHQKAVELYEKARLYVGEDPLVTLFLGLNYLFVGKKKEGKGLLEPLKGYTFDWAVSPETIPEDYLAGRIDADGLKAVFLHIDEKRDSILEKQKKLQEVLKKYPRFRAGILQLAVTWLQLGRHQEAQQTLELHHKIDPSNCTVEYYLSILSVQRLDYNKAWQHLRITEKILDAREHKCKALRGLRDHLRRLSPEPSE